MIIKPLDRNKLVNAIEAANYLLGAHIIRTLNNGEVLEAKIVETESYHQSDPASHTHRGQTKRNAAMFGNAGHAYVYFTYGMHWCFNVTAGEKGEGAGVLIRAAEPIKGEARMRELRGGAEPRQLTNGPAKLAQALGIDKKLYGHDLAKPPLKIVGGGTVKKSEISISPRIGISSSVDELLRFYITNSKYVSKQ